MSGQIDIRKHFSKELCDIYNKLSQLENKRIYELSSNQADGCLDHNISQLRDMLSDLLMKIEGKRPSFEEQLSEYLG